MVGGYVEKSCGCIIFDGDKVLVVKQRSCIYGFPKGHVEEGETEIMTAIRETKEEVGLDVYVDPNLRFTINYLVKEDKLKEVVYFVSFLKNNNDVIIQEEEIESYMWVDIDEVYDILTFDNLKNLWNEVMEKYKEIYNG